MTVPAVGFRAELTGAGLWDLVQMECLARSRQVFRVSGEGGVGYLYFSDGRVIHAVTARLSGQAAALEILAWTQGAFQPCERVWPAAPTIGASHETLILLAAKSRDENAASNLVAFRGRAASEGDMSEVRESKDTPPATVGSNGRKDETLPEFSVMIRVGPGGAIVKSKSGSEELAGVVAYTHRLVELVGELLGLERFMAMECTFKDASGAGSSSASRCLLFTEANGDTVALRPRPDSNIQPLRESLGL